MFDDVLSEFDESFGAVSPAPVTSKPKIEVSSKIAIGGRAPAFVAIVSTSSDDASSNSLSSVEAREPAFATTATTRNHLQPEFNSAAVSDTSTAESLTYENLRLREQLAQLESKLRLAATNVSTDSIASPSPCSNQFSLLRIRYSESMPWYLRNKFDADFETVAASAQFDADARSLSSSSSSSSQSTSSVPAPDRSHDAANADVQYFQSFAIDRLGQRDVLRNGVAFSNQVFIPAPASVQSVSSTTSSSPSSSRSASSAEYERTRQTQSAWMRLSQSSQDAAVFVNVPLYEPVNPIPLPFVKSTKGIQTAINACFNCGGSHTLRDCTNQTSTFSSRDDPIIRANSRLFADFKQQRQQPQQQARFFQDNSSTSASLAPPQTQSSSSPSSGPSSASANKIASSPETPRSSMLPYSNSHPSMPSPSPSAYPPNFPMNLPMPLHMNMNTMNMPMNAMTAMLIQQQQQMMMMAAASGGPPVRPYHQHSTSSSSASQQDSGRDDRRDFEPSSRQSTRSDDSRSGHCRDDRSRSNDRSNSSSSRSSSSSKRNDDEHDDRSADRHRSHGSSRDAHRSSFDSSSSYRSASSSSNSHSASSRYHPYR